MEGKIAELLKDFEDGKMSRRQLIRSLAMVALTAPVAAAQAPPAPTTYAKAPWKTVWLDHISYAVSDYKRSTKFYAELMGWEVENDNGTSQATLKIGDIGGIIIRNSRRPSAEAQPAGAAPAATPGRVESSADHGRDQSHFVGHLAMGHGRR